MEYYRKNTGNCFFTPFYPKQPFVNVIKKRDPADPGNPPLPLNRKPGLILDAVNLRLNITSQYSIIADKFI
jgi:hypothetical protein